MMYTEAPLARIDLSGYKKFNVLDIELEMQGLITDYGNMEMTNHFCVIGYRIFTGGREAHVIWKEKNWLIRWGGRSADIYDAKQLDFSEIRSLARTRPIDMNTDLAETPEDRKGKNFLTLRAGAEAAVANCEAYGKQYTITPFIPPDDGCRVFSKACRPLPLRPDN